MFNALTSLFEGNNINIRMTLRNQLKGVKIQKVETMQSCFTRFAHIKKQLESIGDMVEEVEITMTTWMVYQGSGITSLKEYVLEGSLPSSVDYGKNAY